MRLGLGLSREGERGRKRREKEREGEERGVDDVGKMLRLGGDIGWTQGNR